MMKLIKANGAFRRFLGFSIFLGVGDTMFTMFMMWIIHSTYQNVVYTGIAGFLLAAPMILSFLAGPVVDRIPKPRVLRVTTFIKMMVVAVVLASHFVHYPGVWLLFIGVFMFRVCTVFSTAAYTAILPQIVDGDDLVAANTTTTIFGIVIGVAVAVPFIFFIGMENFGTLYILLSSILVVAMLLSLRLCSPEIKKEGKSDIKAYLWELGEGVGFAKKGAMLFLVVAMTAMSFFSDVAYVNFPAFAEQHMGDGAGFLLLSMLALFGALLGSIFIGIASAKFTIGKIFIVGFIITGLLRIAFVFAISHNIAVGIATYLMFYGFANLIGIAFHVLKQKLPPKEMVGRVDTSITSLTAIAVALGALVGGFLGRILGDPDLILMIQGISFVGIALCLLPFKKIRGLAKISELQAQDEVVAQAIEEN